MNSINFCGVLGLLTVLLLVYLLYMHNKKEYYHNEDFRSCCAEIQESATRFFNELSSYILSNASEKELQISISAFASSIYKCTQSLYLYNQIKLQLNKLVDSILLYARRPSLKTQRYAKRVFFDLEHYLHVYGYTECGNLSSKFSQLIETNSQ